MAKRALIVGGAGATGRCLVAGLVERGFELSVLHRGVHEPDHLLPFRHLHADPHFAEPVQAVLADENFDVVILTYGRIEALAPVFAGRCERLIAVGGIPVYAGFIDPGSVQPGGMSILARECGELADPALVQPEQAGRFVRKMLAAEDAVMREHGRGGYNASLFRYPRIYGPNSIISQDWSVVRRVMDKRPFLLLPNAGLTIFTRCASVNAAHCVLLALDHPQAGGQIFNCGDDEQFSLAQWAEIVIASLGASIEIVGLPPRLNRIAAHFALYGGAMFGHALIDTAKARDMLGYRDVVRPRDAIAASARWWLEHGEQLQSSMIARDPFDYALEDRVHGHLAALNRKYADINPVAGLPAHSYPHPKQPGLSKDHRGR